MMHLPEIQVLQEMLVAESSNPLDFITVESYVQVSMKCLEACV